MANHTPTLKRSIKPVNFTIEGTASKVNENGTFSGLKILMVRGPTEGMSVSCPPMGGGSMFLKTSTLTGLKLLNDTETPVPQDKPKLF